MGNSQKKKTELTPSSVNGIRKNYSKPKKKKAINNEAALRFKAITARAQEIRKKYPKMKWKNAIKKASRELYG